MSGSDNMMMSSIPMKELNGKGEEGYCETLQVLQLGTQTMSGSGDVKHSLVPVKQCTLEHEEKRSDGISTLQNLLSGSEEISGLGDVNSALVSVKQFGVEDEKGDDSPKTFMELLPLSPETCEPSSSEVKASRKRSTSSPAKPRSSAKRRTKSVAQTEEPSSSGVQAARKRSTSSPAKPRSSAKRCTRSAAQTEGLGDVNSALVPVKQFVFEDENGDDSSKTLTELLPLSPEMSGLGDVNSALVPVKQFVFEDENGDDSSKTLTELLPLSPEMSGPSPSKMKSPRKQSTSSPAKPRSSTKRHTQSLAQTEGPSSSKVKASRKRSTSSPAKPRSPAKSAAQTEGSGDVNFTSVPVKQCTLDDEKREDSPKIFTELVPLNPEMAGLILCD